MPGRLKTSLQDMNKYLRFPMALIMSQTLCCLSLVAADKPGQAFTIYPPNPPNDGILFVDHSPTDRSGHLGHALVEYADGKILAFYPNCSNDNKGHSAVGWMEYKRSEDGGKTWSDPEVLCLFERTLRRRDKTVDPKAKKFSAFAEKAISDG